MPPRILILGAGVNGLVAACRLAKAGLAPTVLERRDRIGGCLVTEPRRSGAHIPALSHVAGPLLPEILHDTGLESVLHPVGAPPQVCALALTGNAIVIQHDDRVIDVARNMATPDSRRVIEFVGAVRRLASVIRPLLVAPPPSVSAPEMADVITLMSAGRRARRLSRPDARRLLQWAPMPIADLVDEWFESELLKSVVCARGIFGRTAGPMSAWTTLELLMQAALTDRVIATNYLVRGGPGAVSEALAGVATAAGARVRTSATVSRIDVRDGKAVGVTLESGESIVADMVVSTLDPHRTFLSLVDASWLGPEFVTQIRALRASGVVAKMNLLLSSPPDFEALRAMPAQRQRDLLSGHLHIGPTRACLERAHDATKYGQYAETPWLTAAVPSAVDPDLAPNGLHILSVYAQGAPRHLRDSSWDAEREHLGDRIVRTLEQYAPTIGAQIVEREVITPADLEEQYGLSGGHIFHAEHAVEQLFISRPAYGWARYRTPVEGLYLCGAGAHPGGGVTGAPGYVGAGLVLEDARRVR